MSPAGDNVRGDDVRQDSQFVIWAMAWTVGTRYGGKVINLLTTIALAWLLTKEDFGLAGYALIFVTFIEILEGFGVESALVYHAEDEELQNNAFWISALTGVGIASIVFLTAPLAAIIFDDERAIPLVQVLALAFVFTGLRIVPKALLTRRMQFRLMALPEFVKVSVKGVAAISIGLLGGGAWAMIVSVVIALAAELVVLWIAAGWWPTFRFTFRAEKVRPLLSYGGGMLGLSIIGTLITNIDYVLVGRLLGAAALGAYMIGFRLPTLLITPIIESLSKVIFPMSVRKQSDPVAMIDGWKIALRYVAMVSVPVGFGIASVSAALVPALFGIKWIESVPVVSGIALQTVLISLVWHTGDIYKATGRIRLLFWLGVCQLVITAPLLLIAVLQFGTIGAVAWAHVVGAALNAILRFIVMSRVMPVSLAEIARILAAPLFAGFVMAAAVIGAETVLAASTDALWTRLLADIAVGAVVYCVLACLLMREEVETSFKQLRQSLSRSQANQRR